LVVGGSGGEVVEDEDEDEDEDKEALLVELDLYSPLLLVAIAVLSLLDFNFHSINMGQVADAKNFALSGNTPNKWTDVSNGERTLIELNPLKGFLSPALK